MKNRGFTLIEVLIVVIILGILASIAVPQYANSIEKAKTGEAKTNLGSILTGEKLYYLEWESYVNATDMSAINAILDVDISGRYFAYEVCGATDLGFTAIATRNGGPWHGQTITMDQTGAIGGEHQFAVTR
ncbi:MAG: prepilin-type N-terminal cleavage/methylation domain-containing protein [Candidatus Omnitrophica bacterium]|nr:prepilin-type N-terminal cleavage/methylation domain-containing protein [Candidatus Omnitrophota bacterium]